MGGTLNYSSLSEHVYLYLRRQMNLGKLTPGSTINIGEIAAQLGVSKTPLRDALIHLECEGFVTILPRRGVLVNKLSLDDIRKAYETVGLVEAFIIRANIDKITPVHIATLERINEQMIEEIKAGDLTKIFENNLEFHNTYLDISDNDMLKKFILPIKHRLYDFPRQSYLPEWELNNSVDHARFIECLKKKDGQGAAAILQDVHWSFTVQQGFITQFYDGE